MIYSNSVNNAKKAYEDLFIEVELFNIRDIITTSSQDDDDEPIFYGDGIEY